MSVGSAIRAAHAFVELKLQDAQFLTKLKRVEERFGQTARNLARIGKRIFLAGTFASGFFGFSAKSFADFEQNIARVRSKVSLTLAEYEQLIKTAKDLGATTVFTSAQVAKTMETFARAGFSQKQILDSIKPALDAAVVGQMDLAESANIVIGTMAGMKLTSEQTAFAVDVLSKATIISKTNLQELGNSMKFVGALGSLAGESLERITAALTVLADANISGEMGGTAIRGMILRLTSATGPAEAAMKKLGIQVADNNGDFVGLLEVFEQFEKKLQGMGSAKRLNILGSIFQQRQAAAAAALIDNLDKFRERIAQLEGADGTAAKIAENELNTLMGDTIKLTSAFNNLKIEIGQAFGDVLRGVIQQITRVVRAFSDWAKENRGLITLMAVATIGIAGFGAAIIGLSAAVFAGKFALAGLNAVIWLTTASMSALKLVTIATAAVIGALGSPIALIVGLVAGLGLIALAFLVDWKAVWKEAAGWMTWFWDQAKGIFNAVNDALAIGDMTAAWDVFLAGLSATVSEFVATIAGQFILVVRTIVSLFEFMTLRVLSLFSVMSSGISSFIGMMIEGINLTPLFQLFKAAFDGIVSLAGTFAGVVANTIIGGIREIGGLSVRILNEAGILDDTKTRLALAGIKGAANDAKKQVSALIEITEGGLTAASGKIAQTLDENVKGIQATAAAANAAMNNDIQATLVGTTSVISAISELFRGRLDGISGFFNLVANTNRERFNGMAEALAEERRLREREKLVQEAGGEQGAAKRKRDIEAGMQEFKVKTVGTFSGQAAAQLGGGLIDNNKRQNDLLGNILRNAKDAKDEERKAAERLKKIEANGAKARDALEGMAEAIGAARTI